MINVNITQDSNNITQNDDDIWVLELSNKKVKNYHDKINRRFNTYSEYKKSEKKNSSALTLNDIYNVLYSVDLKGCLNKIYCLNGRSSNGSLKNQLKVIFDTHGPKVKITKLFPGSEKKEKGWKCLESILNNTSAVNELTPDNRQIDLVLKVKHDNINLGNNFPCSSDLIHINNTTKMQWYKVRSAGELFYYSIDFDFTLWKTLSWKLDRYRPVALSMLDILIAGIETGLDFCENKRVDHQVNVVEILNHLRRHARLFSQLVHVDDNFTLNIDFAKEIRIDYRFLAARLSMLIEKLKQLNDVDYISKELNWICERLCQHECFRTIYIPN